MLKKFVDGVLDNFISEDFHISGHMKVKTLQKDFNEKFKLNLRIYKSKRHPAEPDQTLASLKEGLGGIADFTIKAKMTIGELEELFIKHYEIIVLVNDADNNSEKRIPKETTLGDAKNGYYEPKIYVHNKK